jgi:hypothetical protein
MRTPKVTRVTRVSADKVGKPWERQFDYLRLDVRSHHEAASST